MSRQGKACRFLACVFLGAVLVLVTGRAPAEADEGQEGLAISLRQLAEDLGSPEAYRLYGATRVYGLQVACDCRGMDCILIARREPGRPALRLDDLKVAYDNVKGGGPKPACSIDPRQDCLRRLKDLARRIFSCGDAAMVQRLLREWERICSEPQDVRVFGVSPDCHMARAMVIADYDLKSVCNGAETLEGITSLSDILLEKARADIAESGRVSIPMELCSRFWFNPGEVSFGKRGHVVWLTRCEVVLLTEQEAVTPYGALQGLSRPNPFAKQFADQFAVQYKTIARNKPIYRELQSQYRFVALAELMDKEELFADARDVLENLFTRVKVQSFEYPEALPGKYGLKKLVGEKAVPQGIMRYCLYLPSFGGVSMDVRVTPASIRPDYSGDGKALEATVVAQRPSESAVCWGFPMPASLAADE